MSNDDYFAQRPAEPGTTPTPPAPPVPPAPPQPYGGYGTAPEYGAQQPYGAQPQYGQPPHGAQPQYGQPPHGAQPQYAQPQYGYPYAAQKTNGLAVASMVASLVSIVTCGLLGIVGAIMGHMARKQIAERGGEGSGMATTGIIVGWVMTGLTILAIAVSIFFFIAAADGSGGFAA
jgi:hypothetical protein